MEQLDDGNGFPIQLMEEIVRNSLPRHVINDLHGQGIGSPEILRGMFPAHVAPELLQTFGAVQLPRPTFDLKMEATMNYRNAQAEEAFLQWEFEYFLGTRTQNWLSGVVLFITALVTYFYVFQCPNIGEGWPYWPCEGRVSWTFLTLLIWVLPMWNVMQAPTVWQYRDMVCGLHQVVFGCFVAVLTTKMAVISSDTIQLDPIWLCTFPVVMESVFVRVRLKYYVGTSVMLIGLVVSPWFSGVPDSLKLSWIGWLMNCVIMFVGPGCFLVLYEFSIRKCYEATIIPS